jgi:hypothetical protein
VKLMTAAEALQVIETATATAVQANVRIVMVGTRTRGAEREPTHTRGSGCLSKLNQGGRP